MTKKITKQEIKETLHHIKSLRVASINQIGHNFKHVLELDLIKQVWINNYSVNEKGEKFLKDNHD